MSRGSASRAQVEHASRLLLERGYTIDVAYTSRLKRAIRSTWILLQELNLIHLPVYKSWRLNERMYGALEGLSKPVMAMIEGESLVQQWRSGLDIRPPPMARDDPRWAGNNPIYDDLERGSIPLTESLADCMERTLPVLESRILEDLRAGRNVLVVAHGNSLRGIVKHIDGISDDDIERVGIPTAIPLVFQFDMNLTPVQARARAAADPRLSRVVVASRSKRSRRARALSVSHNLAPARPPRAAPRRGGPAARRVPRAQGARARGAREGGGVEEARARLR